MRSIFAPGLQVFRDDSCAEKVAVCTYPKAGLYLFNASQNICRVAVELKGLFTLQCKTLVTMLTGLSNISQASCLKAFADFVSLVFFSTRWARSPNQQILTRLHDIFAILVTVCAVRQTVFLSNRDHAMESILFLNLYINHDPKRMYQ